MDRLSNLVIEQEAYIQKQVKKVYKNIVLEEKIDSSQMEQYIILDIKGFNEQEKVIKSNVILYTITKLFNTAKGIEKIHIEDIIKLCANNIGNKYLMPNKNLKIFIKNGKIKISKEV